MTEYKNAAEMFAAFEEEWRLRPWWQKVCDWLYGNSYHAKWWLLHRFHPHHRYHVIHTGLRPGWHDRDFMMAWLIVKLVVDFVELEKPYDHFDTEESHHAAEWVKLRELYDHFKTIDWDDCDTYESIHDELNEKLIEAVRLRGLLWT